MSRLEENRKPEQEPHVIAFGTVFIATREATHPKQVVLDTGEEGLFGAAPLIDDTAGKEVIGITGTHSSEDINNILGRLSEEQVIAGVMRHLGVTNPAGRIYDILRGNAQKPPRRLP